MSDEIERRAVELAIAAAGQVGSNERDWQLRVAKIAPLIATMMRPPQPGHENDATTPYVTARKVLDATVFRAEYIGFDVEDKTKRLIVKFRSDTSDAKDTESDGTEHMRTEPWWTNAGFVMKRIIENLEPGTPVNVFKHMESFAGTDDRGKAMQKNSRVLVHLEITGKPRSDHQSTAPAQSPRPSERPAPQRDAAPTAAPPPAHHEDPSHSDHHSVVADRFEALTSRQRVAFGRLCSGMGLTDFMNPSDEHLDQVLVNMSKIERGE